MTSVHGNKSLALVAGTCLTTAALLCGGILSEKKARIKMYEKKYSKVLSALELNNQEFKANEVTAVKNETY